MSTTIRPELSDKSKYWIEKHRYYELKHFCLQYPIWKKAYASLDSLATRPADLAMFSKTRNISSPVEKCAEARLYYLDRMKLVEQAAIGADPELAEYLLRAVTEGISFECLKLRLEIPCCKDTYYDRYRKFFWLLNKTRG